MRTGIRKTGTRSCRQFCLRRATSRTAKKRPKSTRSPAEGCIHLLHPNFSAQSSRCDATMHRAVMIALHAALTRASLSRLIFQPGRGFQELGGIVRHEVQAQTRHVMPRPVCQPPTFRSRRFGPRLGGDKHCPLCVSLHVNPPDGPPPRKRAAQGRKAPRHELGRQLDVGPLFPLALGGQTLDRPVPTAGSTKLVSFYSFLSFIQDGGQSESGEPMMRRPIQYLGGSPNSCPWAERSAKNLFGSADS